MRLIFFTPDRGQIGQLNLASRRALIGVTVLAVTISCSVFYAGFHAAAQYGVTDPQSQIENWRTELEHQQTVVDATRQSLNQNIDALALRLGQLNAHVVRLDALGSRLTQMAGLGDGEFDFESAPSLGGPEELIAGTNSGHADGMVNALDVLDLQLADRNVQLSVIEDFLLSRKLRDEVHPEGRPVTSGYISSRFGNRNDPFTGRRAYHKGIDFAGRAGADVVAVASGIVTWSGDRYGYGEMVEVNHGNGYVTRYAHNADNLVQVGDTVKRGDLIARMGETGRATGPNLHFEVMLNGQAVDPLTYIN
jgi:murein DD-endopeptidase MepM/ murein hydrolase activator NlpD